MDNYKKIVEKLINENKTISTMESCTGGYIANLITNIDGASTILKFSAVTYCNEYKIKLGVKKSTIDKYTVYSTQTAKEMSRGISKITSSDFGIGITGQLNSINPNNPKKRNNLVYISVYDRENKKFYNSKIKVTKDTRKENKEIIANKIIDILANILEIEL